MGALPFPHSQTVLVVTVQPERSTLVREKTQKTFPISPIIRTQKPTFDKASHDVASDLCFLLLHFTCQCI